MKTEIFEENLKQSLHRKPEMSETKHFEKTRLLCEKEAYRRGRRERISFLRFLLMQIKFTGWKIWSVQFMLLFLVNGIVRHPLFRSERPFFIVKLLLCLSVLVFMTALPFFYRSVRYGMQEVEAASRFSLVKLLMAKLVVTGIGDIGLLGSIFAAAIIRTSLRADSAVLYLCLPFLLLGSGCLFMLGHLSPEQFLARSMGLCAMLLLMFAAMPERLEGLVQQAIGVYGTLVCVLLLVFCAGQLCYIIRRSSYMEMQIA